MRKKFQARRRRSERQGAVDLHRPFAPEVLARAEQIAARYGIVVRWLEEDGHYFGCGVELPMSMGDGKTEAECVACTRESLVLSVATMIENSQRPPLPADRGERTEQIKVRVSTLEKQAMEAAAEAGGFRSVSDYLRFKALA